MWSGNVVNMRYALRASSLKNLIYTMIVSHCGDSMDALKAQIILYCLKREKEVSLSSSSQPI